VRRKAGSDDVSFDLVPAPSEFSLPEGEKEISPRTSSTGIKRSTSHHSKISNAGSNTPSNQQSTYSLSSSVSKTKKKSWINNALNPTYTSRLEDLRKNFPGLPVEETLIGDYSCALQKDILVHGRIYVTTNFLCFYANIFKWETAVTIRWKDVSAMTKEKTALVIPNAIQICTGSEKLFFCSFATRDKTHMLLFRVWQNALMDCPASQSELVSWVTNTYGEKSSTRISDVEYDRSNDDASNASYDGLEVTHTRPRLYSNIQEENEENKLAVNAGSFLPDRVGDQPMLPVTGSRKLRDSLPTDQSDNTDSEPEPHTRSKVPLSHSTPGANPSVREGIVSTDILTYEVWRRSKDAREVLNKNFKINIDDLFTLLFTNSKFFYDFQAERKTFDIVQCPWQQADKSEEKFRKVSFTLNLNHAMGPKTSRATEVQTMRANSVPGHIYSVDVETINADIPYGDTFYVESHYCIVKATEEESRLTVLCNIKYRKTPWALVKSFIEKNVWAGIEDHYTALCAALVREVEGRTGEGKKEPGLTKKKTRRQRNRKVSNSDATGVNSLLNTSRIVKPNSSSINRGESGGENPLNMVLMFLLCMLCVLNVFLLLKIWGLEHQILSKIDLFGDLRTLDPAEPKTTDDWLRLLQRQEAMHNRDLKNWQEAVRAASSLLHQTENAMSTFSKGFQAETNRKLLKHLIQDQELAAATLPDKTEL